MLYMGCLDYTQLQIQREFHHFQKTVIDYLAIYRRGLIKYGDQIDVLLGQHIHLSKYLYQNSVKVIGLAIQSTFGKLLSY